MGILNDQLEIEQLPLAKVGWQVWDVGPARVGSAQPALIKGLHESFNNICGLTCTTKTLFELVRREYKFAAGIDIYYNNPGISRVHGGLTLPPHYICKVVGNVIMRFMLIAPCLKFNDPNVHGMGKTEYNAINYENDYKEIKRKTLLDLTGTEDSLLTIGSFVRDDFVWKPLPPKEAGCLAYRGWE